MTTLVLATRNAHKVDEIRAMLSDRFEFRTLRDFPGAPQIVEDADSFAGNATKKSVGLAKWLSAVQFSRAHEPAVASGEILVLADDSGLEVDVLGGAPGVHSARFAADDAQRAENTPDADNNAKLLRLLRDVPPGRRTARFRCVIALTPVLRSGAETQSPVCAADEFEMRTELFDGACEGTIGFEPRGARGFGYDPLFIPRGFEQTFAQLGEDVKNRISHRAHALQKLARRFGLRQ